MSYLDDKYIRLCSPLLLKFERKKEGLYNFRCPYCGDSQKHQNKARGYLFRVKNDFVYKCHNCGIGRTFTNFLKDQNESLHDEYILERYREGLTGKNSQTPEPVFDFQEPKFLRKSINSIELEKISDLNISHPAREYLESRKIKDLDYLFYCPKFKEWTNQYKEVFTDMRGDSPRIILPLYTADKKMFGFQGRALSKSSKMRYITVILDESQPKLFGLDRVDYAKPIYVTEGPLDSLFIRNAIAMCGADVDLDRRTFNDVIWIYDNEPRNPQIVSRIKKSIQRNEKVVIWPSNIEEKDINDMVLSGLNVQNVVESNIYQGLNAQLALNAWKKV